MVTFKTLRVLVDAGRRLGLPEDAPVASLERFSAGPRPPSRPQPQPPPAAPAAMPLASSGGYTRMCSDGDYITLRPIRSGSGELIAAGAPVTAGRDDAGELVADGSIMRRPRWTR